MRKSYLKLVAKKKMMNDTVKCFVISIFPFLVFSLLVVLNYYLHFFLKKTLLYTDNFLVVSLTIFSSVVSFCLWKSVLLMKENFFLMKTSHKKVGFFKSIKGIYLSQYVAYWKVSVLKTLLFVSWSTVYFLPCIIVVSLLVYSYRYENYGINVNLTLFLSSVVLFFIGLFHFFVTIKRYSMCSAIILKDKQKKPLKIVAESISAMENYSVEYSFYCISFVGWIMSCVFVFPLFYVLPFVNMSKWCYMATLKKEDSVATENEKPIIFYIQKRIES